MVPIVSFILNSTNFLKVFMLAGSYLVILVTSNSQFNFLCEMPNFEPGLLISNFMLASTESRVSAPIFLVHSIETRLFTFVDRHGFTSIRSSSPERVAIYSHHLMPNIQKIIYFTDIF